MHKKGIILVISLVVMAILLILTGSFFFGLISESGFVNREKYIVQAMGLAEAGASRARSEFNNLIVQNLTATIDADLSYKFKNYCTNNDSLGLLVYYLNFSNQTCPGAACFRVNALATDYFNSSTVDGSYSAAVIATPNGPTNRTGNGTDERYVFRYNYIIESTGNILSTTPGASKTIRMSGGSFNVTVHRDNFAKFALFTNTHRTPSGDIVWFTSNTNFTGPVSTNSNFSFAQNATFSEEVTQHHTRARFYNNSHPVLMDADANPPRDVPRFNPDPDKGFKRGQEIINLTSSVSQSDLRNETLGTMSEPTSNGIYVPNNGTAVTGGIYVRGNSAITAEVGANNTAAYTITQGNTTIVTIDYAHSQTLVTIGNSTQTYSGIPSGVDGQGLVIYDNGSITSLSGTIQKDSSVTIASRNDIVITNNISYQQYDTSPTLNAYNYTNVLGIISWGGNVRIGTAAPNNINIHGVVMAPQGVFTVDNYNLSSPRGTAILLGGAITNNYGAFGTFNTSSPVSGYGRNFIYDARMLEGKTPPYFPYLRGFLTSVEGLNTTLTVWQDEGA